MENDEDVGMPVINNDFPKRTNNTSIAEEHYNVAAAGQQANDPLISAIKMPETKRKYDLRRHSSIISIPSPDAVKDNTFRGKCYHLIHSFKFQAVVICFVILDCMFVISELIVDLRITKGEVCDKVTCAPIKKDHTLSLVLQSASLAILSLFMVELLFKLYALRLDFFRSKMEIFDAVIVTVSWSLDIVFFEHGDETNAIALLIFLRMWRLIRIVHAIAVSMITPVAHQLEDEQHAHHATHAKLVKVSKYSKELEEENKELRNLLQNSNQTLPETKVRNNAVSKAPLASYD